MAGTNNLKKKNKNVPVPKSKSPINIINKQTRFISFLWASVHAFACAKKQDHQRERNYIAI